VHRNFQTFLHRRSLSLILCSLSGPSYSFFYIFSQIFFPPCP
jgi:hypothetical protein